MEKKSIGALEEQLIVREKQLSEMVQQNSVFRDASQKISFRLASIERCVERLADRLDLFNFKNEMVELSKELSFAAEHIKKLAVEYEKDINKTKWKRPLPSTNVAAIDNLFEYFQEQCASFCVEFNVTLSGSIPYMIENFIEQSKLEILLSEHMQNALEAVKASGKLNRRILVVMGLVGDFYEVKFYDNGTTIKPKAQELLGKESITKESEHNSGLMHETTIECAASLIANKNRPDAVGFTKSTTIRFDRMNELTEGTVTQRHPLCVLRG